MFTKVLTVKIDMSLLIRVENYSNFWLYRLSLRDAAAYAGALVDLHVN